MIVPPMNQTAYKLTTTRNKYGDYVTSTSTAINCKIREITELVHDSITDGINSDAMAWFLPDSGIVKGDIIAYEGTHYKVERLTKARALYSSDVGFIKTELMKYGPVS